MCRTFAHFVSKVRNAKHVGGDEVSGAGLAGKWATGRDAIAAIAGRNPGGAKKN